MCDIACTYVQGQMRSRARVILCACLCRRRVSVCVCVCVDLCTLACVCARVSGYVSGCRACVRVCSSIYVLWLSVCRMVCGVCGPKACVILGLIFLFACALAMAVRVLPRTLCLDLLSPDVYQAIQEIV